MLAVSRHVLLSPELILAVASYQDGLYLDMIAFTDLETPLFHERQCDGLHFTRHMAAMHLALTEWFHVWGRLRLPKLFGCLPYMREVVLQDAIWFKNIPLVQHIDVTCGLTSFRGQLLDMAVQSNQRDMLQLLYDLGCRRCSVYAKDWAAKNGNLDMVQFLHQCGYGVSSLDVLQYVTQSTASNHDSVLQFLHAHHGHNQPNADDVAWKRAVASGDMRQVHDLSQGTASCPAVVLANVASLGHAAIVKYLARRGYLFPVEAMYSAAACGHLPVVQFLATQEGACCLPRPSDTIAMDAAASNGHLDVLRFLHERGIGTASAAAMDRAAGNGHVDVIQWLDIHRQEGCSHKALDIAARNNHMEVVEWLWCHRNARCTTQAMDQAAANGHMEVVQFLHEFYNVGCTVDAVDLAAGGNHMQVVQWLLANRSEGCSTRAMDFAAEAGHLDMLQYLHDRRTEGCTTDAMDLAAQHGHLHVVKWLHEHRPEGCTALALAFAATAGHLKIVKWLLKHRTEGCPRHTAKMIAGHRLLTARLLVKYTPSEPCMCPSCQGHSYAVGCGCYVPFEGSVHELC
ncbi:Aste57867_10176 [Aphanomyces stellatus]|uniref:Aste57867_10176 protein n=1 Tax=Aphanomyces stellatus TaxID=120398 RepID=A0A485KQC5_9STRA|nr:hypothetical protein As57867_010137 [Aphanomyces stellatus]VFT87052.1 Aste57867_10176 [Aphanomyces stellatus]